MNRAAPHSASKYRAQPTEVDGIRFASKREAARYTELKLLQRAGQISHLKLQSRFPIVVNGEKITTYVADFDYIEDGKWIVEDVKGVKTPVFRLKAKLMLACHNVRIRET